MASEFSMDWIRARTFLMNAAVVRPWPRVGLLRRRNLTYVVCSYFTISRDVAIGGWARFTIFPVN